MQIFIAILIISIASYTSIRAVGTAKGARDYSENMSLLPAPNTPNCVLSTLSPQDERFIDPLSMPIEHQLDPISYIKSVMLTEFDADVLFQNETYLHTITRSPRMKFIDDVEFLWDKSENLLHVRSCARLGYSDMGANRDRIEKIRTHIKKVFY